VTPAVGGAILTVAEALATSDAWLLAVTVTAEVVCTTGAVNNPVLEIEPALADQVTAVLFVPVTLAVNCWLEPEIRDALIGEICTEICGALLGAILTVAEALASTDAWLLAVTVTAEVVCTMGAVKNPVLEIEPALAYQVTAVLLVPVTVAENCWLPPELSDAVVGESCRVIGVPPLLTTIESRLSPRSPCWSLTPTLK
jgi:predicted NBD/HSP70 family sugar kinase